MFNYSNNSFFLLSSSYKDQTIVQFRGFSKTDMEKQSRPTIIKDYYEKGSLRGMIEAEQDSWASHSYENTRKQIILIGIARGMMIFHSKRIIHRDLKPENVLLDKYYRPRITDFKLSKFVDSKNSLNQSRFHVGNEGYMVQKVLKSNIYSYKADVYSFGIILFEVLTGKTFIPIKSAKSIPIFDRIQSAPITQAFKNRIEKCCSPDLQMRPTFRDLFKKLSLSFEDAEVGEFLIKNALATGSNDGSHDYSLPGVDWEEVRDYLSWIQPQNDADESLLNALSSTIKLETELDQARINELNQKHEIRLNDQEKVFQARIESISNAYQDMITKNDREQ